MKNYHNYKTSIRWTGNNGMGTTNYNAYERSHVASVNDKPDILCSSDSKFRGDQSKYNPEELFVIALSSCHMLWYLHLCSEAGVVVTDYIDNAIGTMIVISDGGGYFTGVTLKPIVTVTENSMKEKAIKLHKKASAFCFLLIP